MFWYHALTYINGPVNLLVNTDIAILCGSGGQVTHSCNKESLGGNSLQNMHLLFRVVVEGEKTSP